MTTAKFLMALQRFIGRWGLPHTVYSDNAKTFEATNLELTEVWHALSCRKTHQFLAQNVATWKFIAPRAAWWGGWWERMVGTTKHCLRKVLGRSSLTEEQLNTTLISIEAAVNSRPITQGRDSDALTPGHFLIGGGLVTIPTGPEPETVKDLAKEFRLRLKLSDDFWKRWQKEYLLHLESFHEVWKLQKSRDLRKGDVVLIQEDMRPRHMWRKAIVEGVQEGRDHKVRTVSLRTPEGRRFSRPVQLVVPLEIDQGGEDAKEWYRDHHDLSASNPDSPLPLAPNFTSLCNEQCGNKHGCQVDVPCYLLSTVFMHSTTQSMWFTDSE